MIRPALLCPCGSVTFRLLHNAPHGSACLKPLRTEPTPPVAEPLEVADAAEACPPVEPVPHKPNLPW